MAPISLHPYPAFKAGSFFAAGILFGSCCPDQVLIIGIGTVALLLIIPAVFVRSSRWTALPVLSTPGLFLFTVAVGAISMCTDSAQEADIPESLLQADGILIGMVSGPPGQSGSRTRFLLEGEMIFNDSSIARFRQTVLVTIKTAEVPGDIRYGMSVALRGTLGRPLRPGNPGEFDQRRYYESNGIGWLFNAVETEVLDSPGGSWLMREIVIPARTYTLTEIDRSIGGQEGEYLKGVLIGERGGLTDEVREAFTMAGVAHILAVSGSNVAVVAAFAFFALELFRLNRMLRVFGACASVMFYMLLVGYQPPVVRATIMAVVLLLGILFETKSNPINSLGVASLIILGIEPRQLFDVGFQLSFLAVFSIIYLYPILDSSIRKLPGSGLFTRAVVWTLRVCAVSLVATLGTLPLTAIYFGRISVIGLIANIAVIPSAGLSLLLGFVSVPLSVVDPWLADTYAALNQFVLRLTLDLTIAAGSLSFASFDTPAFASIDSLPFYAVLALLFHLNHETLRRRFALLFMLSMNVWILVPPDPLSDRANGNLRISFINVGQGDAAFVEFPDGATILIDAGPTTFTYDAGERTVVPFLKRRGIERIDRIVVTHPHSDHMGGAAAMLKEFEVGAVVDCGIASESSLFRRFREAILAEGCEYVPAVRGEILGTGAEPRLYILWPPAGHRPANVNDASVVIRLLYGEMAVLLTGDAEVESEEWIVRQYGDFLNSAILKVGHHGSRTSSTESFVRNVNPSHAVISVGRYNKYGHPSAQTINRLKEHGALVYRTDQDGAVIFETDGERLMKIDWRE